MSIKNRLSICKNVQRKNKTENGEGLMTDNVSDEAIN